MSISAYVDSETINQTDGAQSSRVPIPLPNDPYVAVRTARMVVRTQPTLSPGMSGRIAEATTLSSSFFRKSEGDELGEEDTKEDEEDETGEGLGLEEEATPKGQQQAVLVVGTAMSEPLGLGYGVARHRALESIEEITPSTYEVGQSSRSEPEQEGVERTSAFRQPTLVTRVDHEDYKVYIDVPAYAPPAVPVQTPPSPECSLGSLPVSPSSPLVLSPIASPVATSTATISVDEDQFIMVGAQLDLHGSILYDHTQRLDTLPPILVADIDKDVRELYNRSLEREQERTAMTFGALWRPILALEACAGHLDTQWAYMSRDRYDDHRLIRDMFMQQAAMQRKLQEMRGRVAALE
nr:hypothetical protein [Tanacetum cinerariifolium]